MCVLARSTGFAVTMAGRLAGRALGFLIAARQWPAGSPHPASTSRQVPFFSAQTGGTFFAFRTRVFASQQVTGCPYTRCRGRKARWQGTGSTYLHATGQVSCTASDYGRPVPAPPCLFRFRHRPLARHGSPSTCSSTVACHSRRAHWRSAAGPWRPAGTPPPPSVACLSLTLPGLGFQVSVAAASLRVPASPPCKSLCPAVAATRSPLHGPHRNSDCLPDRQPRGGLQRGSISGSATKRGSRAPTLRRRDVAVAFHCPSFSNPLSPRAPARRNSSPARGCRACGPE